MLEMTRAEKEVYEWALKRKLNEGLFSQRASRILADYIARNLVIDTAVPRQSSPTLDRQCKERY